MRDADNLPPYCAVVKKSRSLNFLGPSGPARPVTGEFYLYLYMVMKCQKRTLATLYTTGNVAANVTLRSVRVTIVVVEK